MASALGVGDPLFAVRCETDVHLAHRNVHDVAHEGNPMNRLLVISEKIATGAAWISGILLLATAFLIAVEVTLRKGFAISMGGADEISSYTLAICCSWTLGFALLKKGHIRIDVLYVRLPRPLQHALDLASLGLFLFIMVVLSHYSYKVVKTSFLKNSIANTPLATPLWIPQGLWFAGLILFTLIILVLFVVTLSALLRGDSDLARKLYGASTLDEEIEDESRATRASMGGDIS